MNIIALKKIRKRYNYYWRTDVDSKGNKIKAYVLIDKQKDDVFTPEKEDITLTISHQEAMDRELKKILFKHIDRNYIAYLAYRIYKNRLLKQQFRAKGVKLIK